MIAEMRPNAKTRVAEGSVSTLSPEHDNSRSPTTAGMEKAVEHRPVSHDASGRHLVPGP